MPLALVYDNSATGSSAANPITTSFTVGNNSNRILLVAIRSNRVAPVTGVTYNGAAFTLVDQQQNLDTVDQSTWLLIAPATGANNFVISQGGGNTLVWSVHSYYNAAQSSQPHQHAMTLDPAGAPFGQTVTASITTTFPNCLIWGYVDVTQGSISGIPNNQTTSGTRISGDNGTLASPGAISVSATDSGSGTPACGIMAIAGAPSALTATITETLTLTDTETQSVGRFATILDTLTLTDTVSSFRGMFKTILDSFSLTDTISNILNGGWTRQTKNTSTLTNQNKSPLS